MIAADALPLLVVGFTLGACAYPFGSWLRDRVERIRPVRWKYRDVCGRQCRIRS
jgi:hypothetical protein